MVRPLAQARMAADSSVRGVSASNVVMIGSIEDCLMFKSSRGCKNRAQSRQGTLLDDRECPDWVHHLGSRDHSILDVGQATLVGSF